MQALQRRDYNTAWRDFMAEAQKGSSDGEAAVGSMLFQKTNPPGTGYYAQCEKWLLASANQGNQHGMDMLAQYYFNEGKNIAGGINPGVNNAPISPQLQAQAEGKFKLARQWFERRPRRVTSTRWATWRSCSMPAWADRKISTGGGAARTGEAQGRTRALPSGRPPIRAISRGAHPGNRATMRTRSGTRRPTPRTETPMPKRCSAARTTREWVFHATTPWR